jgi:hypothetical protein
MNNRGTLARAIRGPILLITIGSLIAFDTFDGYSFSRTWPVIIIVLGILKLFERMTDHPAEPPQPPAAAGNEVTP